VSIPKNLGELFAVTCEQDYPEFQLIFGVSDPADARPSEVVRKAFRQNIPGFLLN